MSYTGNVKPTLKELSERIFSDINAQVPNQDARLRNTVLNIIADALIGAAYELHGRLDIVADQTNILYCTGDNLDIYGSIWGISRKPPSRSTGTLTATGTNGSVIPVDTILNANGSKVTVIEEATIASGTAQLKVESINVGAGENKQLGTIFTLQSAIAGVNPSATVVSLTGGSDVETDENYRIRILDRLAQAPHGGCALDYKHWAIETPGVTRAWVAKGGRGVNSVDVRFTRDNDPSCPGGIPLPSHVETVQAYINDESRKPITADVLVLAPISVPVDITVDVLSPYNSKVTVNIQNELADLFNTRSFPGSTLHRSWIWDAVANATGTNHFVLTSPVTDLTFLTGQMPTLGTVTLNA